MKLSEEQKHKALVEAERLAETFDPEEAEAFAEKHKEAAWYEDFMLLYRMITDRTYKVEKKSWFVIAGALAYVVLPVDVIPDFIPGVGFVDDVFVLGMTMKTIREEIQRYKRHIGE